MNLKNWKYAVKDVGKIKRKGLTAEYHILIDGKDLYSNKTEQDYINDGYIILADDEFNKLHGEYINSICGHWKEITKESYDYALNVLPPVKWFDGGFFGMEPYTADVHDFYQRMDGRYYTSFQRITTKRDNILGELCEAIMKHHIEDRTQETEN